MSRRRYHEMAQARGMLKHGVGLCLSPEEIAQSERETAAGIEQARADFAEATRLRYHPAIKAPQHKCYRVVRRWTGEEYGEDIGFFRTYGEADALLRRELGWAIVIDPKGRRSNHNFQPMTERPA